MASGNERQHAAAEGPPVPKAQGRRFVCSNCTHTITAWVEGNPYFLTDDGKKRYAYHPNPLKTQCVGNDVPHLCLDCGTEFDLDSRRPLTKAPCCGSVKFVDTLSLENHPCPSCRQGRFLQDRAFNLSACS